MGKYGTTTYATWPAKLWNALYGVSLLALLGCTGSEGNAGSDGAGGSPDTSDSTSGSGGTSHGTNGTSGTNGGGSGGVGDGTAASVETTGGDVTHSSSAGGAASTATSDAGGSAGAGGRETSDPVELPEGSSEYQGIVNLVDAAAAADLEAFLAATTTEHLVLRSGLAGPWNLFVEHYYEDYDFVFFVTGHVIDGLPVAGSFEAVNQPPMPGTGNEIAVDLGAYRSDGTLKGVIGIPYRENFFPPFSHELGHYWAVSLDTRFGFGAWRDGHYGPHWGFSSVNGQLGGFDASTLRCETPANELPPNCTPNSAGVTRYVVGAFGTNANDFRGIPYSPFEQYLMGLAPASDVPESFVLLEDAVMVEDSSDEEAGTVVVEAASLTTLPFADIVARHGTVEPLPPEARHFKAAFVVVSADPAPDAVMSDVANWAAVFGNRLAQPPLKSFEEDTGGKATLDTVLGPRRDAADPPPPERERFECDPVEQDCEQGLGCYFHGLPLCAASDGLELDEPCDAEFACAPGLDCVSGTEAPDEYFCQPYCDANDPESPLACDTLCPGNSFSQTDADGVVLASLCLP